MVRDVDSGLQVRVTTTLVSSRKDQEYWAGGIGVPRWASKRPDEPRPIVESAPSPPLPRKPPESPLKRPPTNPRSCAKIPLTHNSLFCIFKPPQSEFLSIINSIISFGHAAFFAFRSYTVGIMLQKLSTTLPLAIPSAILCGMIFSGIAALVIGYFCTRLTTIYFSFLTLAFSQIVYAIIIKWAAFTGGDQGLIGGIPKPPIPFFALSIDMTSPFNLYFLNVLLTILSFSLLKLITASPCGWILRSIQNNPERINFLGINVKRYQIIAFIISGIFSGLAGGLMALHLSGSYPDHAY